MGVGCTWVKKWRSWWVCRIRVGIRRRRGWIHSPCKQLLLLSLLWHHLLLQSKLLLQKSVLAFKLTGVLLIGIGLEDDHIVTNYHDTGTLIESMYVIITIRCIVWHKKLSVCLFCRGKVWNSNFACDRLNWRVLVVPCNTVSNIIQ
jgi:hypothetical protein